MAGRPKCRCLLVCPDSGETLEAFLGEAWFSGAGEGATGSRIRGLRISLCLALVLLLKNKSRDSAYLFTKQSLPGSLAPAAQGVVLGHGV